MAGTCTWRRCARATPQRPCCNGCKRRKTAARRVSEGPPSLTRRAAVLPLDVMKLALFLPNWVGDVVMVTPALRALREHFAGAHLVGVLKPYVAGVLEGSSWLD